MLPRGWMPHSRAERSAETSAVRDGVGRADCHPKCHPGAGWSLGFGAVSRTRALRIADVGACLGVSQQRAAQMAHEGKLGEPDQADAIGPMWEPATIERWAERSRGRRDDGGEGTYCFVASEVIVGRRSHLNPYGSSPIVGRTPEGSLPCRNLSSHQRFRSCLELR
jgi:hypothetical protein